MYDRLFLHRLQETDAGSAHKYFACGSLACMGMAIYSGHKIAPKKKKAEEK